MNISSGLISTTFNIQETGSGGAPGGQRSAAIPYTDQYAISQGTADLQCNEFWDDTRTIAAPTTPIATPAAVTSAVPGSTGATLATGTWYGVYTYYAATGVGFQETLQSPEFTFVITTGQQVVITTPALPAGATGIRVFLSQTSGQEVFAAQAAANTITITAPPASGSRSPSPYNGTGTFAADSINLRALVDAFGVTAVGKFVRDIYVKNLSLTGWLLVGGSGSTFPLDCETSAAWFRVPPGQMKRISAWRAGGIPIISGMSDTLKFWNTDTLPLQYVPIIGLIV